MQVSSMLHTSEDDKEVIHMVITKISIKEQVYEYLKSAIVRGTLAPHTIYSEQMIADELQVSRTPVREAIQLLKHENLVEIYSNRGFGVKAISSEDIDEIIEARLAIEEFGIRRLVRDCRSEKGQTALDQLALCIEKTKEAAKSHHQYEFSESDVAFHRLLVAFTENPYLMQVSDMIHTKQEQATVHSLYDTDRMAKAIREHECILTFLRAGDETGAVRAFEEHMQVTSEILHTAETVADN